jgi:Type IV secretion-system coupling protein DNA-binding domain
VLTDYEFRRRVVASITDQALLDFWQKEFEPLSPHFKNEIIAPIINKVGLFGTHPVLRNILGQRQSAFTMDFVMNTQKIFIANLSKGTLGEDGTQLLGSLLVTQFQTASLARAKQSTEERKPFYLFIDEMHSFMTLSFADILSESRKYGLSLFLTHQFTGQLEEPLLKAILGNTGTLICFRVGAEDAKLLKEEFHPVFDEVDLLNLPQYSIYLKLLIDGTTSKPFSAITENLPPRKYFNRNIIISYTRRKYSFKEQNILTQIQPIEMPSSSKSLCN